MAKKSIALAKEELLRLFNASIDNALNMGIVANQIVTNKSDWPIYPSLGLAEIALEELGKAYSCLAQYSLADRIGDWSNFWSVWRDHLVKAHRGFFFEFFCTLRIEMTFPDGSKHPITTRSGFPKEKELSFYADIDWGNRKIHNPTEHITEEECFNSVARLFALQSTALHVKDLFSEGNESFRNAFSDYALITLTTNMYQQDVQRVLIKMRTKDNEYNKALDTIWELFNPNTGNEIVMPG
jgi:AbiV family abortive infection protein